MKRINKRIQPKTHASSMIGVTLIVATRIAIWVAETELDMDDFNSIHKTFDSFLMYKILDSQVKEYSGTLLTTGHIMFARERFAHFDDRLNSVNLVVHLYLRPSKLK